jgi:hypothetical protein
MFLDIIKTRQHKLCLTVHLCSIQSPLELLRLESRGNSPIHTFVSTTSGSTLIRSPGTIKKTKDTNLSSLLRHPRPQFDNFLDSLSAKTSLWNAFSAGNGLERYWPHTSHSRPNGLSLNNETQSGILAFLGPVRFHDFDFLTSLI